MTYKLPERTNGHSTKVLTASEVALLADHYDAHAAPGEMEAVINDARDAENQPKIVTITELVRDNPSLKPPVIEGILRREEVMNFVSKSKVGKSWGLYGMIFSILSGRDWLGRFPCTPGRVLLVDNELHIETLSYRLPTVASAMRLRMDDYHDRLDVLSLRGKLRNIIELGEIFKTIERGQYSLVAVDAAYRAYPQGLAENDNAMMTNFYNMVDFYAAELSAAFALVIHSTKGIQSDKDTTDVGAGAGSQSRAADTHFIMRAHEQDDCAVVDAAVRSWAKIEPFALRWNFPLWTPADDLDPADLKATKQAKDNAAREQKFNDKRNRVVEYLMTVRETGATQSSIRDHTGISVALGQVLDSLVKDGNIQKCEVMTGRRTKTPCEGWKLVPDNSPFN